jgi:hypothetical protein
MHVEFKSQCLKIITEIYVIIIAISSIYFHLDNLRSSNLDGFSHIRAEKSRKVGNVCNHFTEIHTIFMVFTSFFSKTGSPDVQMAGQGSTDDKMNNLSMIAFRNFTNLGYSNKLELRSTYLYIYLVTQRQIMSISL